MPRAAGQHIRGAVRRVDDATQVDVVFVDHATAPAQREMCLLFPRSTVTIASSRTE
jgi:hypothetical protein